MEIKKDSLTDPRIVEFLQAHMDDMRATSPPESVHALDLEGLRQPEITFWSCWHEDRLVGCGAVKELDKQHGEIKSMRSDAAVRGEGIGSFILEHIISAATARGYTQLSLETGAMDFFEPARRLYLKYGFEYCDPFSDYQLDPNSVYMSKNL